MKKEGKGKGAGGEKGAGRKRAAAPDGQWVKRVKRE